MVNVLYVPLVGIGVIKIVTNSEGKDMKTKLKVGDSFEVVEVINHNFGGDVFKVGGHTVEFGGGFTLLNGSVASKLYKSKYCFGQQALCLLLRDVKPIGKLTITKVK